MLRATIELSAAMIMLTAVIIQADISIREKDTENATFFMDDHEIVYEVLDQAVLIAMQIEMIPSAAKQNRCKQARWKCITRQ